MDDVLRSRRGDVGKQRPHAAPRARRRLRTGFMFVALAASMMASCVVLDCLNQ